jgi:very-short-patch-repair endonuclease
MKRSPRDATSIIQATAARQYGLVSRTQLLAAGFDRYQIHRRVKSGQLVPVLPGVYLLHGTPAIPEQGPMAALLWAGPGAVVSHTTAAALRGWNGFRLEPVHVSLPRRLRSLPRIVVHEIAPQQAIPTSCAGPIATTSVPRTLLDLAATDHGRLEQALDEAIRKKQVLPEDMWLMLDRPNMHGRRGRPALAQLLQARSRQGAPTDSEMEDMFMRIVRRYDLPDPCRQYRFRLNESDIRMDFAYPARTLAIECDSYAWHMDRASFERDRERDLKLNALGWGVLRFTWSMLRWRQHFVAEQVRHHYRSRAHHGDVLAASPRQVAFPAT